MESTMILHFTRDRVLGRAFQQRELSIWLRYMELLKVGIYS